MKLYINPEDLPELRTILHATAHNADRASVIDEVLGWIWEELGEQDIAHMMMRLQEWHEANRFF